MAQDGGRKKTEKGIKLDYVLQIENFGVQVGVANPSE